MTRRMLMGFAAIATLACLGGGAFAADDDYQPLALPSVRMMKNRITLTDDQVDKIQDIYGDYKKRAKDVETKGDSERKSLRNEIVVKVNEILTADQKKKYEALVAETTK